jgi:hypothetical protein
MTSEKQKRKVVELPTQADSSPLRALAQAAFVMPVETKNSAELLKLLDPPPSHEATRQMIHHIAGFFSQVAAWDAQQTRERKAA